MLHGFGDHQVDTGGALVLARRHPGEGRPIVLLHGYPQTHAMWERVAPDLATTGRPVVVADLRGYGESRCLDGDHTFRAMAADVVAVLDALGLDGAADVVGHDRGARVTHRLALDHPDRVASVALLDILPTLDVWELMDDWLGLRYWHWLFLPQPFAEEMVGSDPTGFVRRALGGLSGGSLDLFSEQALAAYETAARRPGVVSGWCGDYRAAAGTDREHDEADLGRTLDIPALVLWGGRGVVGAQADPLERWRRWFPRATGRPLDAGHFLAEERPDEVVELVLQHLITER